MIEALKNIKCSDINKQNSLQHAIELGIPSMKNEEWKYTYYNKILQQGFVPTQNNSKDADIENIDDIVTFIDANSVSSNKLIFINGFFHNELSSWQNQPKINFWNNNNTTVSDSNDFLLELNNALSTDGVFIEVDKNFILQDIIEIFYINTNSPAIINIKNKIKVGENSHLKIVEYYINFENAPTYNNIVTEIDVATCAQVEWYKIQDGGELFNITDNTHITQAANSICNVATITLSGSIIRNVLQFDVDGERCESHMNGLYLLQNNMHVDNRTLINHNVPNCESYELYKGILDGKSTGVFNGKIKVKQIAQKTNAFQNNRNLLLSNDASIYTKPQLEIFADDVKCSHGTTSSQIEDSELFYLQARGIGKEMARGLLVYAFGAEILDNIKQVALKDKLEKRVAELLKIEL